MKRDHSVRRKTAKIIGSGKYLRLVKQGTAEFVERVNAHAVVAIVAVTSDRRLLLTEQPRASVGKSVIDLPAGLTGDIPGEENESLATSAQRELIEETGYSAKTLTHVADCPMSPGLTSEIVSFFVARGLKKIADGGGVDNEQIVVHEPPLREIDAWLATQAAAGKLIDGKVYAALHFAKRRSSRQAD